MFPYMLQIAQSRGGLQLSGPLVRSSVVCCNADMFHTSPGHAQKLPDGYQGVITAPAGPHNTDTVGDGQKQWQAKSTFNAITYWNHDTLPSKTDAPKRCFDWLELAVKVSYDMPILAQELQLHVASGHARLSKHLWTG